MAGALVRVQEAESGLWYQVLDMGQKEGNYLEASGTGMFTYAIAKGVRLGYLSPKFKPAAVKSYQGMLERLVETDETGVHLNQICHARGWAELLIVTEAIHTISVKRLSGMR